MLQTNVVDQEGAENAWDYINNHIYIYIYRQKLLGKKVTSKPRYHPYTSSHTHRVKITVSEIPNHSNTHTETHTHRHTPQKYIKYQWGVKQAKVNILKLQTWMSSSLIEYPINKALCHICPLTKATSGKQTCM